MIHPGTVDWIGYWVLNNWKVEIDFTQGFVFHKVSALHRLKRLLRAPEWSDWWSGGGRAGSGGRDKKQDWFCQVFSKTTFQILKTPVYRKTPHCGNC